MATIPLTAPGITTHHGINADLVSKLITEATGAARAHGTPMAIAVTDSSGVLQGFLRMDGAPLLAVQLAQDKAYTAAAFGIPTDQWHEFIKGDPPLAAGIPTVPRLTVFGGGYPLRIDGQLLGGIGLSGGHYTDDMAVAQAALTACGLWSDGRSEQEEQ
ncbi:GlcG/HbpS family heme-binding protein [Pseudonocardia sp. GCM10023141]|uniref:GlcG/HbpS family heme-binding protein n=1 Tax=Pseudonocardia sp. GCM10023141 TaxID=3252653 RepID=UPI0036070B50